MAKAKASPTSLGVIQPEALITVWFKFAFFLLLLPAIISLFYYIFGEWSEAMIIPMLATLTYMITIISVRAVGSSVLQTAMYRYAQTDKLDIDLPEWLHPTDAPIARG